MDKATEHLLIQEARISKLLSSTKIILTNVKGSLLKPDKNRIKALIKKLPSKDPKVMEREAMTQIPGFKKDYLEAQRKVKKLKFHPYMEKPAAFSTALVSSTTHHTVDDVIKTGNKSLRNAKVSSLIPGSSLFPLIQFGLFTAFIAAVFISGGSVIMPTITLAIRSIILLLNILGGVLKGTLAVITSSAEKITPEKIYPDVKGTPVEDMPLHQLFRMVEDPINFSPLS